MFDRSDIGNDLIEDDGSSLRQQNAALQALVDNLRQSEAKLGGILNTLVDGIITINQDGIIQALNPAAEKMFGYQAEELIGRDINLLMPTPFRENHHECIGSYLRSGKSKIIGIGRETVAIRKDQTVFPIDLALSEVKCDQGYLFTGIIRDITERKEAEAKIQHIWQEVSKAKDSLLSILNMLHLGIITIDATGLVTFINQSIENILGQTGITQLARHWSEVLPLNPAERDQLELLISCPERKRHKMLAHLAFPDLRDYQMEIEVKDDPRFQDRRILFLYDITEIYSLRQVIEGKAKFYDLVGKSESMQEIYKKIQDIAGVDWTVLIEGETGTGKELVARAIHAASPRQDKPFLAVNCAGLTDSLLASQLFGHKRGAFTGAIEDTKGVFEVAGGGTLFLDEIGDISQNMQNSLLRVLENKEITRVGETLPKRVDVRIITATHRHLLDAVEKGQFRQDLYYRLRVARLRLPPLRERRADIPLLAGTFLQQSRLATGKTVHQVSHEAMRLLLEHRWPGNVRELKSSIEFATLHCKGPIIQAEDLPPEVIEAETRPGEAIHEVFIAAGQDEKERLIQALKSANGNRTIAAQRLKVSRATFYRRMEKVGIRWPK